MVDVDDEATIQAFDTRAREVAALHDDRRVAWVVDVIRNLDVGHARKCYEGRGCRISINDADLLSDLTQREGHRELRPERIAVGSRVRRDHEPLTFGYSIDDALHGG
jgi:hypothetical protein